MLPVIAALVPEAIVLFVLSAGKPDDFIVTRSGIIKASPEKVFPHVNELKKWNEWCPWAKLDPNCRLTYTDPEAGVNAGYTCGAKQASGPRQADHYEKRPSHLIRLRLEFLQPVAACTAVEFMFTTEEAHAVVTWSLTGRNKFFFKVFGLFMDGDARVGSEFEKERASLKTGVEASR